MRSDQEFIDAIKMAIKNAYRLEDDTSLSSLKSRRDIRDTRGLDTLIDSLISDEASNLKSIARALENVIISIKLMDGGVANASAKRLLHEVEKLVYTPLYEDSKEETLIKEPKIF